MKKKITMKYIEPPIDFSIKNTTKLQRQKKVDDTIAIATVGGQTISDFTMSVFQEYIDGILEIEECQIKVLNYYKNLAADSDPKERNE